jgi:glycosyltransferase involved in cell wall biosynthesis
MRVLWVSDSPDTPSGFGNVTRFVCEGLARRGHQVSVLGWQTRECRESKGCRLYPTQAERLGADALFPLLVRLRPEAVIALADVWWLPYFGSPHVRRQMELTDTPWLLYFPIDGDVGDERLPLSWIEMLRQVDIPVAMSRYGQRVARTCGIDCKYIPHGVDVDVFCPPRSRDEIKAQLGYEGKFVILSDSRNQPRKMLPRLLDAFAKFAAGREDVVLHLHTDKKDEFTTSIVNSYDVQEDIRYLGLENKVRFTPGFVMKNGQGLPLNELAAYYQAADVHLLASSGEGFGLPTLQAAAAGAVPMACAYSASRELTEGHGEPLPVAEWTENEFGIRRALIDVEQTATKLTEYYEDRDLLRQRSRQARHFAEGYSWDIVLTEWDALLRSVAASRRRIHPLPTRAQAIERFAPGVAPKGSGISVSLKVVDRQYGQLEASIGADVRNRFSDVRIPALPAPCEIATVRVPRRTGYVGLAAVDVAVFKGVRAIFPIVNSWIFGDQSSSQLAREELPAKGERWIEDPEDARYDLAQSVLLLNCSDKLPDSLLIDAAFYGVPCVGDCKIDIQMLLWPELAIADAGCAVEVARQVLTNPALSRRVAAQARSLCIETFHPSEERSVQSLRRLHAEQTRGWAMAGR